MKEKWRRRNYAWGKTNIAPNISSSCASSIPPLWLALFLYKCQCFSVVAALRVQKYHAKMATSNHSIGDFRLYFVVCGFMFMFWLLSAHCSIEIPNLIIWKLQLKSYFRNLCLLSICFALKRTMLCSWPLTSHFVNYVWMWFTMSQQITGEMQGEKQIQKRVFLSSSNCEILLNLY